MIRFLYGANDPDIRYKTGLLGTDPMFVVDKGKRCHVFLDDRELRMLKSNLKLVVHDISPFVEKAKMNLEKTAFRNKLAFVLVNSFHKKKITILSDFPVDIADFLRKKSINLSITNSLYPERQVKTSKEIEIIKGILKRMHLAFRRIEHILRASTIRGRSIVYKGKVLTSEFLKEEIELIFMKNGLRGTHGCIVSSGVQAAIPHHPGEGKIVPNATIVVDLFPEDEKTGYFGDMTRTYCKGIPNEELRIMNDTVLLAQKVALSKIKAGEKGSAIHRAAEEVFEEAGFETKKGEGFIHGTGHGLGLEIHENPTLGRGKDILRVGNIVTVEPGLYYSKIGGVRIEDVVLVTKTGCKNLANYPKNFIIP